MNIERFHNELAMRLGYGRIVEDKRISIFVEESDDPCVVLTLQNGEVIKKHLQILKMWFFRPYQRFVMI